MGFFDFLFSSKPSKKDISAFSYYLFFDFIPKQLNAWEEKNSSFKSVLSFEPLIQNNPIWKSLVKKISINESTLKQRNDVRLYLIKAPSNKMMGEVASAIIAINPTIRKYGYYTMEYSLGGFAICSADESGTHFYMDNCKDGNQFGAYVVKSALKTLIPTPKKQQPVTHANPQSTQHKSATTKFTAEKLLKAIENITDQYYKERKVVSIEDWLVTHKIGDDFKFYITQHPDEEFDKPNFEVTLMIDAMDHNGRLGIVNKFFPKESSSSESSVSNDAVGIPNIIGKHYTFENIHQIQMGSLRLQPIDFALIFNDQALQVIQIFAEESPRIKKYLPNLDLSSVVTMRKYFANICKKTELGYEFGYTIKMNSAGDNGVIGFIFVHTPSENQFAIGFPEWTIDFCLFEPLEGKAIMRTSIIQILQLLKSELNVSDVYAIVDKNNSQCIKLMSHLPFDCQKDVLVDNATGNIANLFRCNLTSINFQR